MGWEAAKLSDWITLLDFCLSGCGWACCGELADELSVFVTEMGRNRGFGCLLLHELELVQWFDYERFAHGFVKRR